MSNIMIDGSIVLSAPKTQVVIFDRAALLAAVLSCAPRCAARSRRTRTTSSRRSETRALIGRLQLAWLALSSRLTTCSR